MWGWNGCVSFSFHMNVAVDGEQNWTIRKYSLQTDHLIGKKLLSSNKHLKKPVPPKTHGFVWNFFASNNVSTTEIIRPMNLISFSQTYFWLLSCFPNWRCYEAINRIIFQNVVWWNATLFPRDHIQPKLALKPYVTDLIWSTLKQRTLKHFLFQHVQTVGVPKCHANLSTLLVDQNSKLKWKPERVQWRPSMWIPGKSDSSYGMRTGLSTREEYPMHLRFCFSL